MEASGGGNSFDSLLGRKRTFSAFTADGGDSSASASNTHRRHTDLASPPPRDPHYSNDQPQRRPRLVLPSLDNRFPGDGFDFRRPASSNMGPVVDLTQEEEDDTDASHNTSTTSSFSRDGAAGPSRPSRMPRFSVNVIDDEDDAAGPSTRQPAQNPPTTNTRLPSFMSAFGEVPRPQPPRPDETLPNQQESSQDEVEVLFERRRDPPVRPASRPAAPQRSGLIDLTDDDDVVITDSRPRPGRVNSGGINAGRPHLTGGVGTRSEQDRARGAMNTLGEYAVGNMGRRIHDRLAQVGGAFGHIRALNEAYNAENRQRSHSAGPARRGVVLLERRNHGPRRAHHHNTIMRPDPHALFGMIPHLNIPRALDFELTGFNMGMDDDEVRAPPAPEYHPPPEVGDGFTRSPDDNEPVVCPNCGSELSIGGSEPGQQLWIIKSCGHAYCGRCAEHRGRSLTSKKGKAAATNEVLPVPFKKCVVDGCGKPASKTSMIHVY